MRSQASSRTAHWTYDNVCCRRCKDRKWTSPQSNAIFNTHLPLHHLTTRSPDRSRPILPCQCLNSASRQYDAPPTPPNRSRGHILVGGWRSADEPIVSVANSTVSPNHLPNPTLCAGNEEKAEESPFTLHIVSHKSGKPAIATAASTLLHDARDTEFASVTSMRLAIQRLNGVLEGGCPHFVL